VVAKRLGAPAAVKNHIGTRPSSGRMSRIVAGRIQQSCVADPELKALFAAWAAFKHAHA
jgi:hypothetical protein